MRNAFVIVSFFLFSLFSCSTANKQLDYALAFADNNRAELEKVLEHYKADTLKYKAACFLIESMPRYFSYEGWQLDSLKQLKKESITKGRISPEVIDDWGSFRYNQLPRIYDVHIVTADLLIENIDLAFEMWEKRPWSKYYTFEDFCEYILPHRFFDEPLENWRRTYAERYSAVLDSLYQGTDVVEATRLLASYLTQEGFAHYNDFQLPHLGALYLFENRVGYCREACDIALYVMRSVGIPVAIDCYITSPSYQRRHYWNAVIDTTGLSVYFNHMERELGRDVDDGRKRGKVYRYSYDWKTEVLDGVYTDRRVPALFRDPFTRDVTHEYFPTNEVVVELDRKCRETFCYLSIFTNSDPECVDIAKVEKGKATFRNLENGVIYQPVFYDGKKALYAAHPFLLRNDSAICFLPDMQHTGSVELTRKYPTRHARKYLGSIVGSIFEGANRPDFKDAKLLYHVVDSPMLNYNNVASYSKKPYRYIRYTAPKEKCIRLSQLAFFSDTTSATPLVPVSLYGDKPLPEEEMKNMKNVIDGDWLSYYDSSEKGAIIIFDLGVSQPIERIVYIPRNDDNFIRLGDQYELFYQDGAKGWVSLGAKVADRVVLTYSDVPGNTLLWLHNHTRGKEERSFYYQNGMQVFP